MVERINPGINTIRRDRVPQIRSSLSSVVAQRLILLVALSRIVALLVMGSVRLVKAREVERGIIIKYSKKVH